MFGLAPPQRRHDRMGAASDSRSGAAPFETVSIAESLKNDAAQEQARRDKVQADGSSDDEIANHAARFRETYRADHKGDE